MSAPRLSQAGQISAGASFYNPPQDSPRTVEMSSDVEEDLVTSPNTTDQEEEDTRTIINSEEPRHDILGNGSIEHATDLAVEGCVNDSQRGKLGPTDILHAIIAMFEKKELNSSTQISEDALMLLPIMLQTITQFVGNLEAENKQLHMANRRLQAAQKIALTKEHQMMEDIRLLKEKEQLRDTRAEATNDLEEGLGEELDVFGFAVTSDAGERPSKKRPRQE